MPTKIRLQRHGKKGQPFYHLVVADGRAPRDGRFIEKLGTYNPMTHPSTISINFERSLYWVQTGAQPTDTARSILSNQGVMLKHHLLKGVKKGAMTEEQAEVKFQAWLKEKQEKVEQAKKDDMLSKKEKAKLVLEEERKVNEARAAELAKKRAKENLKVEEKLAEEAEEGAVAEATEATAEEEAATEEKPDQVAEAQDKPEEPEKAEEPENTEEQDKPADKAE
ncbi:MAG: 30S ribosomal protein S16 [Bacteroidales bacterium]|nr:30S ribosomal protein S16 [Bacteroidales bacterium]